MNKFFDNQTGVTRTMTILAVAVVLIVLSNMVYLLYLNNSGSQKKSEIAEEQIIQSPEEEEKEQIIEIIIEEPEEKKPDFDYKNIELLTDIVPCYLNDNPREVRYFPEGFLRAFFDYISQDDRVAKLDCEGFDFEEVDDYVLMLLETDKDSDGLNNFLEIIYFTDDNKIDTDEDGYDDLTEVLNFFNPNDANSSARGLDLFDTGEEELTNDQNQSGEEQEETIEEDENIDDDTSGSINPPTPQEDPITQPVDCLELPADEINKCLNDFIILSQTLAPCTLSTDFNRCIGNGEAFGYINGSQQCFDYEEELNNTNFDKCLLKMAAFEGDANICLSVKDLLPKNCINNLVSTTNDASHCVYMYFLQDSINSADGYFDQRACISLLYTNEAQIEEQARLGCESIDQTIDSASVLHKISCYTNLAIEYNNLNYCTNAASVQGGMNQNIYDDCESKLN